jgi:hypothetical protein
MKLLLTIIVALFIVFYLPLSWILFAVLVALLVKALD